MRRLLLLVACSLLGTGCQAAPLAFDPSADDLADVDVGPAPAPPPQPAPAPQIRVPLAPAIAIPRGLPLDRAWEHRWTGRRQFGAYATDLAVSPRGDIAVTALEATTPDRPILLVYARDGSLQWSADVPEAKLFAVTFADGGDIVVAGETVGARRAWVRRYSPRGRVRWTHAHLADGAHWASASNVAIDGRGDVVLAGLHRRHGQPPALLLQKLSPMGRPRWTVESTRHASPPALALDAADGIYVTSGYYDPWVAAYAGDGRELWHVELPVHEQRGTDLVVRDTQVFVATGDYAADPEPTSYIHLVDTRGTLRWSRRLSAPPGAAVRLAAIALASDGDILVTGAAYEPGRPTFDVFVASLGADASAVAWWDRAGADGEHMETGAAIAPDGAGGLVLLATAGFGDQFQAWLQRFAPDEVGAAVAPAGGL